MEDQVFDKLERLKRYMPFIEYLLEKDAKKHEKFIRIKSWILTKKKFPVAVFDKIEQSIITQYKNLFLEDVKIPKAIMEIFNSYGEIKCIHVNLCSDEENDGDDVDIVSVSVPMPKQLNINEDMNDDKKTIDIKQRMNEMPEATDEPEVLEVRDKSIKFDEASQLTSHSTIDPEENLFKRRRDFLEVSECPKNKSTPAIPTIDLVDIDEDDDDDVAESVPELPDCKSSRVNESHLTQTVNISNSISFKDMNVDSLIEILTTYTKQNDINLDSLLYNIASPTESNTLSEAQSLIANQISSREPTESTTLSVTQSLIANQICSREPTESTTLSDVQSLIVNKVSSREPWLLSTIDYVQDVPHRQLSPALPPSSMPSVLHHRAPPFYNKLNLKDPRIIKHLQKIQNSPECSHLLSEMLLQPNAKPPRALPTTCIPREPKTYGEYRRLRAVSERNVHNLVEKSIETETETIKKKVDGAEEVKSVNTNNSIKNLLMSTLQPYEDKIVDVLRNQKGIHEDEAQQKKIESTKLQAINSVEHKQPPLSSDEYVKLAEKSERKEEFTCINPSTSQDASEKTETEKKKRGKKRKKHNIHNLQLAKKPRKVDEPNSQISIPKRTFSWSSVDTTSSSSDESEFSNLKASILMNQPQVLLHRLTDSELRTYTGAHTKTLNVELVENSRKQVKQFCSPPKNVAAISNVKHKNLDCLMTERNTKFCVLCKSKPSDLTNHYRRTHKGESYVSRLTWEELDDLQLNIPFAEEISNNANVRVKKCKVMCAFCKDELEDSFLNFYMHYSIHTGEYAFQCGYCKLEKPFRVDIQSHQCHSKMCRGSRVQILYQYPPNAMVIYLYSCKICNFVQLNEANVFKHLRDHHDRRQDDAINVQKNILAAIKDSEISYCKSSEPETNLDFPGDDNITVLNEPLAEDTPVRNLRDLFGEFNEESKCEPTQLAKVDETSELHSKNLKCNAVIDNTNELRQEPIFHIPMTLSPDENDIKPKIEELDEFVSVDSKVEENFTSSTEFTASTVGSAANSSTTSANSVMGMSPEHQFKFQNKNLSRSLNNTVQNPYRSYRKDTPYFGLLKCMADDCFFSTDIAVEMFQHLCDHNDSECPPDGLLRCAYCLFDTESFDSAQTLISHVQSRHGYSRYQCSSCCYRSLCPSQVRLHQGIAHAEETNADDVVYECSGPITPSDKEPDLPEALIENVRAIICPYCPESYYALNQLQLHLSRGHKIIDAVIDQITLKIGSYACVYCSENLSDEKQVQMHLALTHPDERSFACLRFSNNTNEVNSVWNLQLVRIPLPDVPSKKIVSVPCVKVVPTHYDSSTEDSLTLQKLGTNIDSKLTLDSTADVKPDLGKCIQINEDIVKCRLHKLIANTGVSPDRLYSCPQSECGGFFSVYDLWYRHMSSRHRCIVTICPHCPMEDRVELTLSDFQEHFKQHCCHLFMCFHCGETFSAEQIAKDHAAAAHPSITALRMEKIDISLKHPFAILIEQDQHRDQLAFLLELQEVITKRLSYLEVVYAEKLKTQWVVPLTAVWLEDFPSYSISGNRRQKCITRGCTYQSYMNEELYAHMRTHKVFNTIFSCFRCDFKEKCKTWDDIIDHVNMHHSNLYICCVCSYHHFERSKVRLHIQMEHKHRDVPLLSLLRSCESTKMALSIVFAQTKISFSTLQTCFCCSRANLGADSYALHLKKTHGLTLQYFCEICDIHIPQLSACDEHFSKEHALEPKKMRCELSSHSELVINTVKPLSLKIENSARSQITAPIVHKEFPSIKEEPIDDDIDADIVMVDEDDVVIFKESKSNMCEQTSTAVPPIRCVNIKNLQCTTTLQLS